MKKLFNNKQRFSLRKSTIGVVSVALGMVMTVTPALADEITVQEPTVVVEETVAEVNNNITEVAPAEVQPVNEVSVEVKTAEVAELPIVETSAVEAPAVEAPAVETPVVETRAATKRVATTRTATTRATTARTAVTRTTTPVTETATQEVASATVANSGEQKETKVVIKDVFFSKLFGDAKEEKAEAVQESATTNLELEFQKLLEQVHSGEIMPDTDLVAQDSFTKFNARENIPSSGTYRFKERLGIKNQPKVSAANIAYYNAGQTVNYDSVLETDGHQWISYISYSGARRYIAINALATSATATNNNNTTPKTTVTARATTEGLRLSIDTNQVKDKTKILYAVWSEVNGQDDLQWYTADKNGNYVVKYDNHKGLGNYQIHTYSGESGNLVILNNLTVRVTQAMVDRAKTTTVTTQEAPAQNIPSSGTYQFTGRSGVKAQPKVSSPDLAFYDKGMTVNYDSVLNSDGKQWLSYLSYDGNRRYVAIGNATATQPATTPATSTPKPATPTTTTQNIPTSGTYYFNTRAGIKAQPKVSSPDVAYYDKGMSVNYDSVRNSDGKQWISYLSHAGGRYYIAVDNSTGSATKPASTPTTQPATSPAKTTTAGKINSNVTARQTQNTYPYGECTWGAKEAAPWAGNNWGHGNQWADSASREGYTVGTTPSVGAIIVWQHGMTTGNGYLYGHVGVVKSINADGTLIIHESNMNGNRYVGNHRGNYRYTGYENGGWVKFIYPPKGY